MKHAKAVAALLFANAISQFSVADDEKIPVSFDQVFPITWYKKALDACMHVWAELDVVRNSGDTMLPEDRESMLYTSVGRLVLASTCLDRLSGKHKIPSENLGCLVRIADTIKERVNSVLSDTDEQRLCFTHVLCQLRKKVKMLITKSSE